MTNNHNRIDKDLKLHSKPNKANDDNDLTFIHAQLAYAKSKHSKQAKAKQRAYKKRWYKKGVTNE